MISVRRAARRLGRSSRRSICSKRISQKTRRPQPISRSLHSRHLKSQLATTSANNLSILPYNQSHRNFATGSDPGDNKPDATRGQPIAIKESNRSDARVIFDVCFDELVRKYGAHNLLFPKDIMWLAGAPGSGKGEMTAFISEQRGIFARPIILSELLVSEEAEEIKRKGLLVSDSTVLTALLERLLRPEYRAGAIVDGFPRTPVQAESVKLLFDRMLQLRRSFEGTEHFDNFRRPVFHITVLFVEEEISIKRQIQRGREMMEHNKRVEVTGVGMKSEIRPTDVNSLLAQARYSEFRENVYESLKLIKDKFPFHFINANDDREAVRVRILNELEYQSRAELADETFDNVRQIPLASEIRQNARHELVRRLDRYQRGQTELFDAVIDMINEDFVGIIRQQALTGQVIIRSENPIFARENALTMALDLLSERGYRVVLDYLKEFQPDSISKEGKVIMAQRKIFVFHISFPPPRIRHAVAQTSDSDSWGTSVV